MSVESKNNMRRIETQIDRALSQAVRKAALRIEARAKTLAPVDTGLLRNSIQTNIESLTKASVGTNTEYAAHQEFGTRNQKGTPFLTPAADIEKKEFEKDLRNIERSLK